MRIVFRTKNGISCTLCPYGMTNEDVVIRVGSNECLSCKHFISGSYNAKLVRCGCIHGNTFNDGLDAAINFLKSTYIFSSIKDKNYLIKTLEKLRK